METKATGSHGGDDPSPGGKVSVGDGPLKPNDERVAAVARSLVDAGRFVPALEAGPNGGGLATWWPLPGVGDRNMIAALVLEDSLEGHAAAASALARATDLEVRRRLAAGGHALVPPRPGRRTVPHAWIEALGRPDPALPSGIDPERVAALANRIDEWIATGADRATRVRLAIRVHEPPTGARGNAATAWRLELLAQDSEETSLLISLADLWDDRSVFGPDGITELLGQLGRAVRLAPELAPVLDEAAPTELSVDTAAVLAIAERVEPLAEVGVAVLLPSWWTTRPKLGLRAKAASPPGVVTQSGFGLETLVSFRWEAALGTLKLTKADLKRLEAAAAAKSELVRIRGQWVQVDPDRVAALVAAVGTEGQADATELLRAHLGLSSLDAPDGIEVDGVTATGWLGELLDDALAGTVTPVEHPPGFQGTLRPYQQRGVGWLAFLGRLGLGACLADDMGLGKTAQLIATVLADPVPGPTLVIAPVSVLGNWQREIGRFAPELSVLLHHGGGRHDDSVSFAKRAEAVDVVLTTYSLVARDADHLAEVAWGRLALDEAQQVKNPRTKAAKAVAAIPATRRIALTGTPVENRLAELWSLMNVLNPGLLGTLTSFTKRFAGPIERDGDEETTALLRRITGPFVLRRLKSDRSIIDDLPDKIEQTELCTLTHEQATLYQAVVDELLEAVDELDKRLDRPNRPTKPGRRHQAGGTPGQATDADDAIARRGLVLAGITKLKQICNHPAHFLGDGSALGDRSGKLNRTEELLDEIIDVGDKVLCFTQYTAWGDLLADHFARRYGIEPLWLHGGVQRKRRDEMLTAFEDLDGPPIFLLSLKAGGTGLNLTAASHVIHLDRWWNPAIEDQATDRAYRIGQRRAVDVHKLVSMGTIEERIDAMINDKRALAKAVVGTGEGWVTELSTEDLRGVISLRDREVG